MKDPFKISEPTSISFSGGRTSGYMLWRVLQSNGGTLPENTVVCFANTGKERDETLDFVQECSERWAVKITWLEYDGKDECGKKQFKIVDHSSASRNGEPFMRLIRDRQYLPNPVARFCTVELKIRVIHRYLKSIGMSEWNSFIGIRADEPLRVAKIGNNDYGKFETKEAPLARAGIAVAEVGKFWSEQPFDLKLPNMNGVTMHGNCDLCFLKGGNQILSLIRENPARAIWWIEAEAEALSSAPSGAFFRKDRPSYKSAYEMAINTTEMFPFHEESIECVGCTD